MNHLKAPQSQGALSKSVGSVRPQASKSIDGSSIPSAKPMPPNTGKSGVLSGAAAGLPRKVRIPELDKCVETFRVAKKSFDKMLGIKDMVDVEMKVKATIETLKEAQEHLKAQDDAGIHIAEQASFNDNLKQI